jgi:hypothetical protein
VFPVNPPHSMQNLRRIRVLESGDCVLECEHLIVAPKSVWECLQVNGLFGS